jgi:methionine synthase I (cobalamin-dependent)
MTAALTKFNFAAAKFAREIAGQFATAAKPRFVAGSIGPASAAASPPFTTEESEGDDDSAVSQASRRDGPLRPN